MSGLLESPYVTGLKTSRNERIKFVPASHTFDCIIHVFTSFVGQTVSYGIQPSGGGSSVTGELGS